MGFFEMSIINMEITSKYEERPERLKYQTKRHLILTLNIRPKYCDIPISQPPPSYMLSPLLSTFIMKIVSNKTWNVK